MYCSESYPKSISKRLAIAPKSLIESWTDAHRHRPSANDLFTNWHCLLNQKPDKGPHKTDFWTPIPNNTNRCGEIP